MPLHAALRRPLLIALLGVPGMCPAQQPYGDFHYPGRQAGDVRSYGLMEDALQYRWRPLGTEASVPTQPPVLRDQRLDTPTYPSRSDYVDEPLGLPPGTYRRIEERHTITPHREGFRFRPIDPNEQQRVKDHNKGQYRKNTNTSTRQPTISGWGNGGYQMENLPPKPKFRPDKRLDKTPSGGAVNRYAYPQGSRAPVFRSE
ncbi:MAG: hypothetical protein KZQ85_01535 [Candidatus Thiodiazotropha sp. (ex Myrtea sp. 'scaly one' KF741663)]|nr:hypothetical protein [Candidatus Thiodiazotropha sp. (ex Myrtea sp. 'scaly one' KF741663)]